MALHGAFCMTILLIDLMALIRATDAPIGTKLNRCSHWEFERVILNCSLWCMLRVYEVLIPTSNIKCEHTLKKLHALWIQFHASYNYCMLRKKLYYIHLLAMFLIPKIPCVFFTKFCNF